MSQRSPILESIRNPIRRTIAGPKQLGTQILSDLKEISPKLSDEAENTMVDQTLGASTAANMSTISTSIKERYTIEGRLKNPRTITCNQEILTIKYNENYEYIAAGCTDGTINLFDTQTTAPYCTFLDNDIALSIAPVTSICHRPVSKAYPISNRLTCTYANGFIKSWNYVFKKCIFTIKEARQTFGLAFHPRYPKFVTFGDDLRIFLYDEERKAQERILSSSNNPNVNDGPRSRVFAACFNPRSNFELITGGWDDTIHFWDLRQPYATKIITGAHIAGDGLDISAKGTEILACSFQAHKQFQVFDYTSGKPIITEHSGEITSKLYVGKFVSKDYAIIGGTAPNAFQIVEISNAFPLAGVTNLPHAVYSLDVGQLKKMKEVSRAPTAAYPRFPAMCFCAGKKIFILEAH